MARERQANRKLTWPAQTGRAPSLRIVDDVPACRQRRGGLVCRGICLRLLSTMDRIAGAPAAILARGFNGKQEEWPMEACPQPALPPQR